MLTLAFHLYTSPVAKRRLRRMAQMAGRTLVLGGMSARLMMVKLLLLMLVEGNVNLDLILLMLFYECLQYQCLMCQLEVEL